MFCVSIVCKLKKEGTVAEVARTTGWKETSAGGLRQPQLALNPNWHKTMRGSLLSPCPGPVSWATLLCFLLQLAWI